MVKKVNNCETCKHVRQKRNMLITLSGIGLPHPKHHNANKQIMRKKSGKFLMLKKKKWENSKLQGKW